MSAPNELSAAWRLEANGHVDAVPRVDGDSDRDDLTELAFREDRGGARIHLIGDVPIPQFGDGDALVDALADFDVGISGLSAGVNLLLTLPDGTEHEVLRRAGEAGIALNGLSIMRHPLAGPDIPAPEGIIVGFAEPAEYAFAAAINALCGVLKASGL
jgi:hypothetical protein